MHETIYELKKGLLYLLCKSLFFWTRVELVIYKHRFGVKMTEENRSFWQEMRAKKDLLFLQ